MGTCYRVDALREVTVKRIVQEGNDQPYGFHFRAAQGTRYVIGGIIKLGNRPMNTGRGGLGDIGVMVEHPRDGHGAHTCEASHIAYRRLGR